MAAAAAAVPPPHPLVVWLAAPPVSARGINRHRAVARTRRLTLHRGSPLLAECDRRLTAAGYERVLPEADSARIHAANSAGDDDAVDPYSWAHGTWDPFVNLAGLAYKRNYCIRDTYTV